MGSFLAVVGGRLRVPFLWALIVCVLGAGVFLVSYLIAP